MNIKKNVNEANEKDSKAVKNAISQNFLSQNDINQKELEHLTFAISHDLRNVVNHISGFFKLLESNLNKNLDDKDQRYVKIINERLLYLNKMLDEVLHYNHIIRSEVNLSKINLNEIINQIIDEFSMDDKSIKEQIRWKIGSFPLVVADSNLLKELFKIIISNAIKFSKVKNEVKDKVNVEIYLVEPGPQHLKRLNDNLLSDNKIIIAIKDNGIGFNLNKNDRLFNLFQKLHSDESIEGVGAGLAKALIIANMHHDIIWAEGIENEGATFYLTVTKA